MCIFLWLSIIKLRIIIIIYYIYLYTKHNIPYHTNEKQRPKLKNNPHHIPKPKLQTTSPQPVNNKTNNIVNK